MFKSSTKRSLASLLPISPSLYPALFIPRAVLRAITVKTPHYKKKGSYFFLPNSQKGLKDQGSLNWIKYVMNRN